MIKKAVSILAKYKIWFSFLMLLNGMFGVFIWLTDEEKFIYIFPTMLLGSLILYSALTVLVYKKDRKKERAVMDFLENPDPQQEEIALRFTLADEGRLIRTAGEILREKEQEIRHQNLSIQEYEEFIEAWAHEIKTPVALMTFVLDNRKDEISPVVYQRMEYARTRIAEDIEKILYYARLKAAHTDYYFDNVLLGEVCREVIEEYSILLKEQKIMVINHMKEVRVLSDKKGLMFVIRQVISNSIKYTKTGPDSFIRLSAEEDNENGGVLLRIRDNGTGVKAYDLPFIFDKGFTGDMGEQKKNSTGMGLYLAKQVADNLNIKLEVSKHYQDGFEMIFRFPEVHMDTGEFK